MIKLAKLSNIDIGLSRLSQAGRSCKLLSWSVEWIFQKSPHRQCNNINIAREMYQAAWSVVYPGVSPIPRLCWTWMLMLVFYGFFVQKPLGLFSKFYWQHCRMIVVAMETSHWREILRQILRSSTTIFVNWLKTCRKTILRHLNFCLTMILRQILGQILRHFLWIGPLGPNSQTILRQS